jgi:hypothetical protein
LEITVHKLDHDGREVWQYPATELERDTHSIRLEAFFNRDDMDLGYVVFKRGDRFIETFYSDRWYNVFAVYDRDDNRLKGWYCNICRPAEISETAVRCDDLALDVWVSPSGDSVILDEVEFEAMEISNSEQILARGAIVELQNMMKTGRLPL